MGEALTGESPLLVLLHAAGLDRRMWHGVAAELTEFGHDVDAVDLLGHGAAATPSPGFELDDVADDLAARLPARPVVLVGVSLGGMVAQICAVRRQVDVAGLVLANTMASPSAPMRDALRQRAERTAERGMAGMVDETVARWFPEEARRSRPDVVAEVRTWLAGADTVVNADTWRAIARLDVLGRLADVDVPTLVVSGGADVSVPAAVTAEMCAALPDATHVVLPEAGHLVPLEAPDRFVAEVDGFVRTIGKAEADEC